MNEYVIVEVEVLQLKHIYVKMMKSIILDLGQLNLRKILNKKRKLMKMIKICCLIL